MATEAAPLKRKNLLGGKTQTDLTLTGLLMEGLGECLRRHLAHSWVVANIDLLFARMLW